MKRCINFCLRYIADHSSPSQADSYLSIANVPASATQRTGGYGGFGVLIAGYDYQFSNYALVLGGFVDGSLGDISGSLGYGDGFFGEGAERGSWQIGGRFGSVINDVVLPYFSAGYSRAYFSNVNYHSVSLPEIPVGLTTPSFSTEGWFIGTGLETKLTKHWSLKGEYRFASYQTIKTTFAGIVPLSSNRTYPIQSNVQTFQLVINYRI